MFVFTVELVSVVKPQKLKKAKPRKSAFRMVDSEASSSDSDEYGEEDRRGRSRAASMSL